MNDDVSLSSHTHSHLHNFDVEAFVWLQCHKESKEMKENSNWIELIDTSLYKETFIFPGTHSHTHTLTNHERMQWRRLRKGINDDDATVDDKNWNIESAESSHASTLFELKLFCETCMSQCLTSCSICGIL